MLMGEVAVQTSDSRKCIDLYLVAGTGGKPACKRFPGGGLPAACGSYGKQLRRQCSYRKAEEELNRQFHVLSAQKLKTTQKVVIPKPQNGSLLQQGGTIIHCMR